MKMILDRTRGNGNVKETLLGLDLTKKWRALEWLPIRAHDMILRLMDDELVWGTVLILCTEASTPNRYQIEWQTRDARWLSSVDFLLTPHLTMRSLGPSREETFCIRIRSRTWLCKIPKSTETVDWHCEERNSTHRLTPLCGRWIMKLIIKFDFYARVGDSLSYFSGAVEPSLHRLAGRLLNIQ